MIDFNTFLQTTVKQEFYQNSGYVHCRHNRTQNILFHILHLRALQNKKSIPSIPVVTFKQHIIQDIKQQLKLHHIPFHIAWIEWIQFHNLWDNLNFAWKTWNDYKQLHQLNLSFKQLASSPEKYWKQLHDNIKNFKDHLNSQNGFTDHELIELLPFIHTTGHHYHLPCNDISITPMIDKLKSKEMWPDQILSQTTHRLPDLHPDDLAKQIEQQHPDQSWAIVCPQPETLEQSLQLFFTKNKLNHHCSISAPMALSRYTIVRMALTWLETQSMIVSTTILQDYFEANPTFQHDPSITQLIKTKKRCHLKHVEHPFAKHLHDWVSDQDRSRTLSQWATSCLNFLKTIQWPFHVEQYNEGYQITSQWIQLIQKIQKTQSSPVSYSSFIDCLTKLTENTFYQAKHSEQNICILSPNEAIGLPFDKITLLDYQPHIKNSSQFPFIHDPQPVYTEKELISILQKQTPHLCIQKSDPLPKNNKPRKKINIEISKKMPLGTSFKASSQLIKDQAHCPFKAFGTHRLNIKPLPDKTFQLSPLKRGILVHNILEDLSKNNSLDLSKCIHHHLRKNIPEDELELEKNIIHLESKRLHQILNHFIENENIPHPLNYQCEVPLKGQLHHAQFSLRIDRLDQLSPSTYRVIDFKTGTVNCHHWLHPRLLEPQLPLYSVLSKNVKEIAFITLKPDQSRYLSLSFNKNEISNLGWKIPESNFKTSDEVQAFWNKALTALINEYYNGYNAVKPHPDSQVCQTCHLKSLCRIYDPRSTP